MQLVARHDGLGGAERDAAAAGRAACGVRHGQKRPRIALARTAVSQHEAGETQRGEQRVAGQAKRGAIVRRGVLRAVAEVGRAAAEGLGAGQVVGIGTPRCLYNALTVTIISPKYNHVNTFFKKISRSVI